MLRTLSILTALLFSGFSLSAQAPTFKVTYTLQYQYDSTDVDKVKSEEMVLYTSATHSKYGSANFLLLEDSLTDMLLEQYQRTGVLGGNGFSLPRTDFRQMVFKNRRKLMVVELFGGLRYQYREDPSMFRWQITPEQKSVAGYVCQKAVGNWRGRTYEAWFAPEIPIPDGPYKFCGLPGLILEIYDLNDHYHFTLRTLEEAPGAPLKYKERGQLLKSSAAELASFHHAKRANPDEYLAQLVSIDRSPEERRAYRASIRSWNNPMELVFEE